jgi:NADPH2:quinone reductase
MSLPTTMRAVEITQPGGPEVLQPTRRPVPQPGPGEILVRVAAAGVNRPDILQRKGLYPVPKDASDLPGLEVAGIVVACGAAVTRWKVGDAVCGLTHGGGYAELCVVPEGQALPVPLGLSLVEAASLPETFFTVWANVFENGRLQSGETLLVHGGSSGIGVTAIQMAKAIGARVFTTAGSDEKCAACAGLGADLAINYRTQDFEQEVLAATDNLGVDVILDMVGGDYVPKNIRCLGELGRLVFIASLRGTHTELDIMQVMRKRLTITGSTLRPRSIEFKAALAAKLQQYVWPMLEDGRIRPVIFRTFPLEEASAAHALLETSEHVGKLVLTT